MKLLKSLSKYYPELPSFGITNKNRNDFRRSQIISRPDLEVIEENGCAMERGDFPFRGIYFDEIPLEGKYLDSLVDQIVNNSEKNLVTLILSKKYWL